MTRTGYVESTWQQFMSDYACPKCQRALRDDTTCLTCDGCGTRFSTALGFPDFRIENLQGDVLLHEWAKSQASYERSEEPIDVAAALANINGCREVYLRLPPISGRFLDVGGGYGLVRHFLPPNVEYLSIDPWTGTMHQAHKLSQDSDYVRHFPYMNEPFAFVCGFAERLPFGPQTFDWVHMRSVIDHVADPQMAMNESARVMRPGSYLLLGVAATGGPSGSGTLEKGWRGLLAKVRFKLHQNGVRGLLQAIKRRLHSREFGDHHTWHPSIVDLRQLVSLAGLNIVWEHWTQPPYEFVVYILSQKGRV